MRLFFGIVIGLVLAVAISAFALKSAFGNIADLGERDRSKDVTETYDLRDFEKIEVGGVYELNVSVGPDYSISISGAREAMDMIEVGVENGALQLGQEDGRTGKKRWRNMGYTATITMPSLNGVDVAGVADAEIEGIDTEEFTARLSGVGEIDLSGTCGMLYARVSGVGDLDAEDLECADVDVRVSGIGEANVYASASVDAAVGGIGSITVYGSPSQVETDKTMFSDITIK